MRTRHRLLIAAAVLLLAGRATAAPSSTAPGSLLVFPLVSVDAGSGGDTDIRLTNLGDQPQAVRCVYVDGSLTPGSALGFQLLLAARQPVAWLASRGGPLALAAGSVPAVPATPFSGTLRCVAAESDGTPTAADVLVGNATIVRGGAAADSAAYNATGFLATGTSADEPDVLVLGGAQSEYAACPAEIVLQPLLDGAVVALGAEAAVERTARTRIAVATCSSDPVGGASATIDLQLTNELGQRFTARRALREHLVVDLSRLDTGAPAQSIFTAANAGSATGSLRITPTSPGSAVLAVTLTALEPASGAAQRVAHQPQLLGERGIPGDLVDLAVPTPPPSRCPGDCDGDASVAINELITGVNIALGGAALDTCPAFDTDDDGAVAINELIAAVNAALAGCPA
jgi:hypothetical protein